MSVAAVRSAAEYEERLQRYLFERSEEARAVRVGEKEVSEQAEIVARYADLFTRAQLDALREAEDGRRRGDERERLYRLRKTCEGGPRRRRARRARGRARERDPRRARRRSRARRCRCAPRRRGSPCCPTTRDREELGDAPGRGVGAPSTTTGSSCSAPARSSTPSSRAIADPVARNEEEKGDLAPRARARARRRRATTRPAPYAALRDALVRAAARPGARRGADLVPHGLHAPALAARVDVHEGARDRGLPRDARPSSASTSAQRANIQLDLDDRPQKSPRACVIASDPPSVVHLITRAQGGLHDYQAFLHEAGHALHYAGCDPALPYTFRRISRDHALTEIYSYICEAISREPGWHARHFGLSDEQAAENAEATRVPRGAALPPLRGEAALRARLLVALRRRTAARPAATRST